MQGRDVIAIVTVVGKGLTRGSTQAMQPDEASSEEGDGHPVEARPTSGSSRLAYTQEQANLRSQFLQASIRRLTRLACNSRLPCSCT